MEGTPPALSTWRRAVAAARVFARHSSAVRQYGEHPAARLAKTMIDAWVTARCARKVRLWMMDGDGFAVFSLLEALRAAWSDAELDARVQLTVVDQTQVLCDYHAWAIPCAELLAGNVRENKVSNSCNAMRCMKDHTRGFRNLQLSSSVSTRRPMMPAIQGLGVRKWMCRRQLRRT
jgi:hypothetical protein